MSRAKRGAVLACVCAGVVTVLVYLFLHTVRGQALDQSALQGSVSFASLSSSAKALLSTTSETSIALAGALLVTVALAQRRWREAIAALVVVTGANVTTQVLKHVVLTRPDLVAGGGNSLPSGHTTVAMSLACALLIVAPARFKRYAAWIGALYATASGIATLIAGWHRPSDVLVAYLVTCTWVLLTWKLHPDGGHHRGLLVAASVSMGASILAGAGLSVSGYHPLAFLAGMFGCIAGACLTQAAAR